MVRPDIHSTREGGIPRDVWLAAVRADAELRLFREGDEDVVCHWTAHKVRGEHPWFIWYDESVDARSFDRMTLRKALALAAILAATVTDDNDTVYTTADNFNQQTEVIPQGVLGDVFWSFPADAPADRGAFDRAVWERQYRSGNDFAWDPEAVVVRVPQIDVAHDSVSGTVVVRLTGDSGGSFTAGELLFKIQRAFAAALADADHRYFEGLELSVSRPANAPPLYHLCLGS